MDQTKYVNAYIDSTVGMLHENILQILQLKAQLKVINDLVNEKDNIINELNKNLSSNQSIVQDYHKILKRNQVLENEIVDLKNDASQIAAFSRKIFELEYRIIEKDNLIEDLNNQLKSKEELKEEK